MDTAIMAESLNAKTPHNWRSYGGFNQGKNIGFTRCDAEGKYSTAF